VNLFLGPLFYFISSHACFYANNMLFLFLWHCCVFWNNSSIPCSAKSALAIWGLSCIHIQFWVILCSLCDECYWYFGGDFCKVSTWHHLCNLKLCLSLELFGTSRDRPPQEELLVPSTFARTRPSSSTTPRSVLFLPLVHDWNVLFLGTCTRTQGYFLIYPYQGTMDKPH
jgi:hypothetical protein